MMMMMMIIIVMSMMMITVMMIMMMITVMMIMMIMMITSIVSRPNKSNRNNFIRWIPAQLGGIVAIASCCLFINVVTVLTSSYNDDDT